MFFNVIFFVVFLLVGRVELFSQDVNIDIVENTAQVVVEDTDTAASENSGGSFFDILPVDENAGTNSQNRPAFLDDIESRTSGGSSITNVFVRAIAGVIFFFGILYMLYKYFRKRSKAVIGSSDIIKVLATTVIAQNKSLSIVEIADNIYFISVTDKAITMMSEITDKDSKDAIRLSYAKSSENVVEEPFSSMFDKALVMFNVKKKSDDKDPLEVTREMTEKIKTMDNNVESHLNSEREEVNTHATISIDKINRYVKNDAVGKSIIDNADIIDEEVPETVISKKKTSKKSSKK